MTELESLNKQHSDIDYMFDKSVRNINAHSVISINFAIKEIQDVLSDESDIDTVDLLYTKINELKQLLE